MVIRLQEMFRVGLALAIAVSAPVVAQIAVSPAAPGAGTREVTFEQYKAQLASARELVAACKASAAACDPAKVGGDDHVTGAGVSGAGGAPGGSSSAGEFDVHWSWLWDAILKAKDAKLADRDKLLDEAAARLAEESREAGVDVTGGEAIASGGSASGGKTAGKPVPFQQARADADKVLARAEFQHVTKNPFWERFWARVARWFGKIFDGMDTLGRNAPWLGAAIEWGFLALALAGLLVWVLRAMSRQRLAIRLETAASWQEASRNWAKLAEDSANASDWREAVHALYWASVVELEGRRVWRQNNARTPREYLRLLPADAPQYRPLRAMTQLLERIWYGLTPAGRGDYDAALRAYEELRSA